MANVGPINLKGKVRAVGPLRFVRAELPSGNETSIAIVYYSINNEDQPLGLRLDRSKRIFLDTTGIDEVDKRLDSFADAVAEAVSSRTQMLVRATPRSIDLRKGFELDGYFWMPGTESTQTPGTLSYLPGDKLQLKLTKSFPYEGSPFEMRRFPLLSAQFTDGGIATLLDCFATGIHLGAGGEGPSRIVVNRCIIGAHAPDFDTMRFSGCHVRLTSLEEWMGDQFVTKERRHFPGQYAYSLNISYARPEPVAVRVGDKGLDVLLHSGLTTHSTPTEVQLEQVVVVEVRRPDDKTIEDWLEVSWSLQMMFTLFFGEPAAVREQAMVAAPEHSPEETVSCPFVAVQRIHKVSDHLHPIEMLLPRSEISGRLEYVVNEWFRLYDKAQHALQTFFSTMFHDELPSHVRLMLTLNAMEIYHRSLYSSGDETTLNLRDRLEQLIDRLPPEARESIVGNVSLLLNRVVATRNYLSHGQITNGVSPLDGVAGFVATEKLRTIFFALLLLQLGTPEDRIVGVLNRKAWMRWAMHQSVIEGSTLTDVW